MPTLIVEGNNACSDPMEGIYSFRFKEIGRRRS